MMVKTSSDELAIAILKASMTSWPAEQGSYLDGWYLRRSNDITKRCNSVWPLFAGTDSNWDNRLDECEAWYASHDAAPIFQINSVSPCIGLDNALQNRGYTLIDPSIVQLLDLRKRIKPQPPSSFSIDIETRPTNLVMNTLLPADLSPSARSARARLFNAIRRPRAFAIATAGGEPLAGGMVVVDGDLAGIFGMYTHARARRRGMASAILNRLLDWAQGFGANYSYLQVEAANIPALTLYKVCGFKTYFNYHYRMNDRA